MPHTKTTVEQLYFFEELSETAKEKAREWYREGNLDYEWWDCTYEQVQDAAKYLGIEIDTKPQKSIGGYVKGKWDSGKETTREETCIYFSGFSSQGDGASFLGTWKASNMKPLEELKADFGTDEKLWGIHARLADFALRYPDAYCTSSRSSCHYSHERSTNLEAVLGEDIDYNKETHAPLEECLVSFMLWIYACLEDEYNWLNSDESIDESIKMNEYEFTEDGKRA